MKNYLSSQLTSLIILLLIAPLNLAAQNAAPELPEVIGPSPTVASLMHFEEVPVSYYTGQPDIQFPIYSKPIGSGVTIPITLRYNTMGLRLDERSGWVGTGWSLDGEIVISRTVRGLRDEANDGDVNLGGRKELGVFHNGFYDLDFTNTIGNLSNSTFQRFLWNASGFGSGSSPQDGAYDKEPDLYQLSLLGSSARFVIVKNGTNLEAKMLSNDSNLKVDFNYDTNSYAILDFTITDTNGVKYLLDVTETNSTVSGSASILQDDNTSGLSFSATSNISAWKVREIKSSNSKLLATYSYQTVIEEMNAPESSVEYKTNHPFESALGYVDDPYGFKAYNASVSKPKRSVTLTSITITSEKLSSILFRDGSKIDFLLGNSNHPEYTNSGAVLEDIEIKDENGNLFKRFDLIYSGFNTNDRLFLDQIKEYFNTNPVAYTYNLTYKNKGLLPRASDPSWIKNANKDVWGYYKEAIPPSSLLIYSLPYKSADKDWVDTGSLQSISYPTGGIKEFVFESNTFSHRGSEPFNHDEFKALNMDNWDFDVTNGPLNTQVVFNNTNSGQSSIQNSDIFEIIDTQTVQFVNNLEIGVHDAPTDAILGNILIELNEVDQNNNVIGQINTFTFLDNTLTSLTSLQPGRYQLSYTNLTLPSSNDPDIRVTGTLYFKRFKSTLNEFIYGGGLRISKIMFKDADDSIKKAVNYDYAKEPEVLASMGPLNTSFTSSSGVVDGFLTNIKEYQLPASHIFVVPTGTGGNAQESTLEGVFLTYDVKEHLNSVYVSMTKGNYVGYGDVTTFETGNGKTIYKHTTPEDFPTYGTNYGWPFLPEEDQSHLHGVLKEQKVYNQDHLILKEVVNTYHNPLEVSVMKWPYIYQDNNCAWTQLYNTYDEYLAHFPPASKTPPGMGNVNASYYDNCADRDNTSISSPVYYNVKDYYFTKYQLKETITKDYFYDNASNQSVTEQRQEFLYNNSNYQIKEQNTYFNEGAVETNYKTKYFYPVDGLPIGYTGSNDINRLIDLNKVNDVVFIENYKDGQKLSQVNNIYHEFETDMVLLEKTQTLKGTNTEEDRIEYKKYDSYGNPLEVKKTDGMSISYVWGYNKTLPVAKVVNATYAEIETVLGQGFNLNNSGLTLTQDNSLRSSLVSAQITTYAYDPLIGILSMRDPRGYTMTYEYDDFNRLKHVKDQDSNILSKNEYNYANQN